MRSRHAITSQFHLFEVQDRVFAQTDLGQEILRASNMGHAPVVSKLHSQRHVFFRSVFPYR